MTPRLEDVLCSPEFYADDRDYGNRVDIVVVQRPPADGSVGWARAICAPVRWEPKFYDDRRLTPDFEPTMDLSRQSAIALMTALWKAGIRPAIEPNELEQRGEIRRLEAHLTDMRNLVFRTPLISTMPLNTERKPLDP